MRSVFQSLLLILLVGSRPSAMAAGLRCSDLFTAQAPSQKVSSAVLAEMADLWMDAQRATIESVRLKISLAFVDRLILLERESGTPRESLIEQIRRLLPIHLKDLEKNESKAVVQQKVDIDSRLRWDLVRDVDTGYIPPLAFLGLNSEYDEPHSGFDWTRSGRFFGLRGYLPGGKGDVTRIFSSETGKELPIQANNGTFSHEGELFAAKVGNEVHVWDLNQPARPVYARPSKGKRIVALTPDMLVLGTGPREGQWIYLKNGDLHETRFPWSYDSSSHRLAYFDQHSVLRLIDATTGQDLPVPVHLQNSRPQDPYAYFSNPMVLEVGSKERAWFLADLTDYQLPEGFYIEKTVREKILILSSSQPVNKIRNQVVNFATGKVAKFKDPAIYSTDGKSRYLAIASQTIDETAVFDFETWKVTEKIPKRIWVIKGRYLMTKDFSSASGSAETTIYDMENKQAIGVPESGDWRLFEFDQATSVESQSLRVFDIISQKVTEFPKQDMQGEVLFSWDGKQALQQFSTHFEVYRLSQ